MTNALETNKLSYARIAQRFWNALPNKENDYLHFVLTLDSQAQADPQVESGVLILIGKFTNINKKEIAINTINRQFDEKSINAHVRCEVHQTAATFDISQPNEMHLVIIKKREGRFNINEVKNSYFPFLIDCIEHEVNKPAFKGEYRSPSYSHPYDASTPSAKLSTKRGKHHCRHHCSHR